MGLSIGSGVSLDGKLTPQGTSAGIGKDDGDASSTTQAAISGIAGNTAARTRVITKIALGPSTHHRQAAVLGQTRSPWETCGVSERWRRQTRWHLCGQRPFVYAPSSGGVVRLESLTSNCGPTQIFIVRRLRLLHERDARLAKVDLATHPLFQRIMAQAVHAMVHRGLKQFSRSCAVLNQLPDRGAIFQNFVNP